MKTLKITPPDGYVIDTEKSTFENIVFKTKESAYEYTDIKSYEDACKVLGTSRIAKWDSRPKDEIAFIKLKTIIKAINQGWEPDWNNGDQLKYFVIYHHQGFLLISYTRFATYYKASLYFESEEKGYYMLTQFEDLYKDFYL
jgi:hypothetical protein